MIHYGDTLHLRPLVNILGDIHILRNCRYIYLLKSPLQIRYIYSNIIAEETDAKTNPGSHVKKITEPTTEQPRSDSKACVPSDRARHLLIM